MLDNIGLPYSTINLMHSTSGLIGAGDADVMVSLKEDHRPTADDSSATASPVIASAATGRRDALPALCISTYPDRTTPSRPRARSRTHQPSTIRAHCTR